MDYTWGDIAGSPYDTPDYADYYEYQTEEEINARNARIELEQDPFEVVYADTYKVAV